MAQLNSRMLDTVHGSNGALRPAWEVVRSGCVDHFVYAWVAATAAAAAHGRSGSAVEPWGVLDRNQELGWSAVVPSGAAVALGGDHVGVYGGHLWYKRVSLG